MNPPQPRSARHLACFALFLIVVFAFFLRYALIHFGFVENQIPTKRNNASIDRAANALATTVLTRFEVSTRRATAEIDDFAKQNALLRIPFSELNMGFRRLAGMRLFPDADNTLRLDNGYLIAPRTKTGPEYCRRQVVDFHQFCESQGVPFLYVLIPNKSARSNNQLPFGIEDHCVANADRLVAGLTAAGVPTMDLRAHAEADFTNYFELFFRTDHHWKPEGGLWAAARISEELNRLYDFDLPVDLLAPSNFNIHVYPRFFLGSLGKKLTRAYAAPEDFSLITPKFDTSLALAITNRKVVRTGTFRRALIDERQIAQTNYYHRNPYAAYLFGDPPGLTVSNRLRPEGRHLLVVKDSFANVVTPFLALVAARLDVLDLRYFTGSIRAQIEQNRPEAVVILYNAGNILRAPPASGQGDPFGFN